MTRTPGSTGQPILPLQDRLPTHAGAPASAWLGGGANPALRSVFVPEDATGLSAAALAEHPEFRRQVAQVRARIEQELGNHAKSEIAAAHQRYAQALTRLAEAKRQTATIHAGHLVDLALMIASEILKREIAVDRATLVRVVEDTLGMVEDREGLVVRMAHEDLVRIHREHSEVLQNLSLVEDPALQPGDVMVEAPTRLIDGTLKARLDAVGKAVRALLADVVRAEPESGGA